MENKKGKILTVTSMKGGGGKTTTVMMLADIFSKYDKKVFENSVFFVSCGICMPLCKCGF